MQGESSGKVDFYVCIGATTEGMRDLMALKVEREALGMFTDAHQEYFRRQQDSFPVDLTQSEFEEYRKRFPNIVMRAL